MPQHHSLSVRLKGLEPLPSCLAWPSTMCVYQFRHKRKIRLGLTLHKCKVQTVNSAPRETRTLTTFRTPGFESSASAIPPSGQFNEGTVRIELNSKGFAVLLAATTKMPKKYRLWISYHFYSQQESGNLTGRLL